MRAAILLLAATVFQSYAQQWTVYGGDHGSKRFSPLKQINASNVSRLGVNWVFQPGVSGTYEATPLFEDGILYFTAPGGHAYALDARTGKRSPLAVVCHEDERRVTDFGVSAPGAFWYTTDDGQRYDVSRSASARECNR